jgi:hypothetical protein
MDAMASVSPELDDATVEHASSGNRYSILRIDRIQQARLQRLSILHWDVLD